MSQARYHFSGVAGAGMSPLARLMRARGHPVQGSDRSLDAGRNREAAEALRAAGVELVPHDGRAVTRAIDRFVFSTAVEADTPEMRAARDAGVAMVPRPALLAEVVNSGGPGVAVAGTSGKSTVTGMVAWLAREAGVVATVVGGATLVGEGGGGCLVAGPAAGAVAAEACESDGTLVGYRPALGLIHNVSRDHGELDWVRAQFATFAGQCGRLFVNARCREAAALGRAHGTATSYGATDDADAVVTPRVLGPTRASGVLSVGGAGIALDVPQPGLHNLENAAAAALVALELGVRAADVERLLPRFPGVARRFETVGTTPSGIRVIDDFAHNGEKIRAALTTAQAGAPRVVAVFQPHGFGPARFLRAELRALLPGLLRPRDRFCYAEVFYAGGSVTRDVSSRDLAADAGCAYAKDHAAVARWVAAEAEPGDTVLLMGARDPDLPRLARGVYAALGG
jgi:UDP-N-acetylmuramate--alanine ligase